MAKIIDFMAGRRRAEGPPGLAAVLEPERPPASPLFFNVRSFACSAGVHTLQFGFVDAQANVVFSAFADWPTKAAAEGPAPPPRLSVAPLDAETARRMLDAVCRRADLVGFHRVLQGGLLPLGAVRSAASLTCVWRRVQDAAKSHRLCRSGERPITLNAALRLAGLGPLESDDAVVRALAVRELWLWLDRLG